MIGRGDRIEINTQGGAIQDAIIHSKNSSITKISGSSTTTSAEMKALATELDALLKKISEELIEGEEPTKIEIASKATREVKKNQPLKSRVISALKEGSIEALKQMMKQPAATFFIAALKDFLERE